MILGFKRSRAQTTESFRKASDLTCLRNRQLMDRCMRQYGWSLAFASQVCEGYRAFMDMKKALGDWDAAKLSPSLPIDKMWHQHILDTRNYAQDCMEDYGHVIHHDPDGDKHPAARQERIRRTIIRVRRRFEEEYNKRVWDFGVDVDSISSQRVLPPLSPKRKDIGREDDQRDTIVLSVLDMTDRVDRFKIKPTTPLRRLFKVYAERRGIPPDNLRILCRNHGQIDGTRTAEQLGLQDGDCLYSVLRLTGC